MSMIGEATAGALYRLDSDGQASMIEEGFGTINGIGWSPDDQTIYVTDSLHRVIYAYDFDKAAGAISRKRRFAEVAEDRGMPGGLTVDADGYVWSAHWDGWCVTRYAPDGQIDRVVTLPVPRPMSCMFGGPELKTIFVTTARIRLTSAQLTQAPLSGSVFSFDAHSTGIKEPRFKHFNK
jgi:sugar lactone lactonase YvrE